MGRFKLFPNETDVVAAAGKAVDRSDRAIGSNALKGLFHLPISGIIITSNIEHFSLEPQTTRVRECGLIIELTSRIFRVCDASQYQHHWPRVATRLATDDLCESGQASAQRMAAKNGFTTEEISMTTSRQHAGDTRATRGKIVMGGFWLAVAATVSAILLVGSNAHSEFIGDLQFTPAGCEQSGVCEIKSDFSYKDAQGMEWLTKAGDKTDGASIPSWAQPYVVSRSTKCS